MNLTLLLLRAVAVSKETAMRNLHSFPMSFSLAQVRRMSSTHLSARTQRVLTSSRFSPAVVFLACKLGIQHDRELAFPSAVRSHSHLHPCSNPLFCSGLVLGTTALHSIRTVRALVSGLPPRYRSNHKSRTRSSGTALDMLLRPCLRAWERGLVHLSR